MTEKATFGAGCFWHPEERFRQIKGVLDTEVGFMGGDGPASYKEVCAGGTGHAEVVQVEFDPQKVSYKDLLEIFWSAHDPTQVDRQGPDIGEQYRSVIFYHSEDQKKKAERSLRRHQEKLEKKIATSIERTSDFYRAEEYHQQYLEKRRKKES